MTEKEKLQQLFEAALKSPTDFSAGPPKRAFPSPAPATRSEVQTDIPGSSTLTAPADSKMASEAAPTTSPVLTDAASTELAVLLDEQLRRKARKHRIEAMVTAIVFFGLSGGGVAWFVQSSSRVEAFTSAMREIRSVGDVKSIIANYQVALDQIAVRSQQIDHASEMMEVSPSKGDEKDPHFNAEMKEMMGGEGKTAGERGEQVRKAFGHMQKHDGQVAKTVPSLSKEKSVTWE
ncbi:MAG: hypothetical protein Q8Q59_08995 [Luteolibacter sp.]|nr:hypothetical protein [Luteolibacter sp.]